MFQRAAVCFALIVLVTILLVGCHKRVLVEGKAQHEKAIMKEEEQFTRDRERMEASLQAKTYPGIEGEVFETIMLKDIHFAFDRYDLSREAREILARNAEFMLKFPEVRIQIEGHCDERGTNEYNLALGERRAMSARNYLKSLGVSSSRLATISYGEELPIDPRHHEEAWAKNRRSHFVVLSK